MYCEFYGLKELPFNITPDPKFLFFTNQHKEAFNHLLYGIQQRKGFIQLTGEVGSGKTTLCRAVLSALPSNVKTALVLNPGLTENQLLRAILTDFGIKVTNKDKFSYIERLNSFLLDQLKKNNNVTIIIDEAQNLSSQVLEQIRLLSNLETDQHKLMQIVLCGQPELREKLMSENLRQLRQRITVRYHLTPLSESDVALYINHRMKMAGWQNQNSIFTDEAISAIYSYTQGVPRLINAVCDIALLAGFVAGQKIVNKDCVFKAIKQLEGTE